MRAAVRALVLALLLSACGQPEAVGPLTDTGMDLNMSARDETSRSVIDFQEPIENPNLKPAERPEE